MAKPFLFLSLSLFYSFTSFCYLFLLCLSLFSLSLFLLLASLFLFFCVSACDTSHAVCCATLLMNAPYAATTPAHCDSIGLRRAEKAKGVDRSSTVIAKEPEGSFHPLSLSLSSLYFAHPNRPHSPKPHPPSYYTRAQ